MTLSEFSSLGAGSKQNEQTGGFNVADLLYTLPESQKPLVRLMMRNSRGVTLPEAAADLQEEEAVTRTLLDDLTEQGYVQVITDAGEARYRILLKRTDQIEIAEDLYRSFTPGSPIAVIPNPSGDYAIRPGETFVLSVTVSNKGNQSALIDIFIDEGGAHTLNQWCGGKSLERLALGCNSSSEVVFEFKVPADAMPGVYNYLIVVDAPQHYPEDTPIRHPGRLQILLPVQEAIGVNDPTFTLTPATSSLSPAVLKPGELLQVVVEVHNRSDRVDRFRLTCPDLPAEWFTVRYPEGIEAPGLVTQTDGLALNPNARGQILLFFNPGVDTDAGSYVPSVRLYSANYPDLVMLDVVYIQFLPVYLLNVEVRPILSKVSRMSGLFEVRFTNLGNTIREVLLYVHSIDEEELCTYTLEPALRIFPRESVGVGLKIKPTKWWRRPFYGGGLLINFCVELEDPQQLPLPPEPPKGVLVWQPRPWWQFLLLILTTLGSIAAIAFLIWWFFFKPPDPPKVIEFSSQSRSYEEADGNFIRLNWQIRNPRQLEAIKITSQSPDGTVFSEPRLYNFSQGIPNELKEFCNIRPIAQVLVCNNVRTDARKAGNYIFELQSFSKKDKDVALDSRKTQTIKILPFPLPKVVDFYSTKPIYEEIGTDKLALERQQPGLARAGSSATLAPNNPPNILLNWKILHPDQLKEVKIIGRSPDGTVTSSVKTYNFSQGVPDELKNFCAIQEALICRNVATDASKAGDYIFEMTIVSKKEQGEISIIKKTDTVKIKPQQVEPKIIYFKINDKDALPKYILPLNKNVLNILNVSWKVEGGKDIKVELLPAPGTVTAQGSIPYPLSQKPTQETITLKVTSGSGQQLERSVTIDIFEQTKVVSPFKAPITVSPQPKVFRPNPPILPPAPPIPSPTTPGPVGSQSPAPGGAQSPAPGGAQSPTPGGTQSPVNPNSPSPVNPDSLSPSELPPQSN